MCRTGDSNLEPGKILFWFGLVLFLPWKLFNISFVIPNLLWSKSKYVWVFFLFYRNE